MISTKDSRDITHRISPLTVDRFLPVTATFVILLCYQLVPNSHHSACVNLCWVSYGYGDSGLGGWGEGRVCGRGHGGICSGAISPRHSFLCDFPIRWNTSCIDSLHMDSIVSEYCKFRYHIFLHRTVHSISVVPSTAYVPSLRCVCLSVEHSVVCDDSIGTFRTAPPHSNGRGARGFNHKISYTGRCYRMGEYI